MNKKVIITGRSEKVEHDDLLKYKKLIDPNLWRKMDNYSRMAVIAANLALDNAGIDKTKLPIESTGVVLGTMTGPIKSKEDYYQGIIDNGMQFASALMFPNTVMNMATGMVTVHLGVKGPNCTIVTSNSTMDEIIEYASDFIIQGKADILITGVVDEYTEFSDLFDDKRNGSEIVILESEGSAKNRGWKAGS